MQTYAKDAQQFQFPDKLLASGAAEIRERFYRGSKSPTCTPRSFTETFSAAW
jgi:hypothetical protein